MQLFVVQGGYNMAHFAELNGSNVVQRVLVFSNVEIVRNGGDWSSEAETHISSKMGGTWKQCFKDNGLRKQFPAKGDIYDFSKDKFIKRQPYASWSLNADDDWQSPVPFPTIETYDVEGNAMPYSIFWDEPDQIWKALDQNTPANTFEWNAETLTWDTPTP